MLSLQVLIPSLLTQLFFIWEEVLEAKKKRRNEDPLEFYCTNYCTLDYLDMKWSPGYEEEEDDSN